MNNLYKTDKEAVDAFHSKYLELRKEIGKVIVGQDETVRNVLISIFSQGHGLLVGVPGLAKTLLVSTISKVLGLNHSRIQFTPDLMPSDITGAEILDEKRAFRFIKGPVFANVILADEINRTPPKTQAALLEAMQEHAVTIAGNTYKLEEPFFVLATQNPIEQEGTYPLPEAQLDRFMFNIWLDYPTLAEELAIVKNTTTEKHSEVNTILSREEIVFFQQLVRKLPVTDQLYEYAVKLAVKTRPTSPEAHRLAKEYFTWGAGPRASQYLIIGAKCHAALNGKYAPDREDVNAVARPILRHRVVRNFKAEAEGLSTDDLIMQLFS